MCLKVNLKLWAKALWSFQCAIYYPWFGCNHQVHAKLSIYGAVVRGKISLTPQCSVFVFFVGKIILASTKAVYVLVPLPLERQIQDLLANHRVEEALILTEGAQRNIPKDKFQVTTCLRRWYVGHTVHLLSLLENLNMLILLPKLILLSFIKENIFHNYKLDSLLNCHFLLLQNLHKRILQQAGFIQFGQLQFLEAKEHFR